MTKLIAKNVVSGYEKQKVLKGVSARFDKGKCIGIIGPNGSGKSTFLKTIVGLTKVWSGMITVDDKNITNLTPPDVLRHGISYIPQGRVIFPEMTVEENLKMGAYSIKNIDLTERIRRVFDLFEFLEEKKGDLAKNLSGGMRTALCIGRALMMDPVFLLFDEPSLGLAPKLVNRVYEVIETVFKKEKLGLVIVEQNVSKVLSFCEYIYVLSLGQIVYEGKPEEISSDKKLAKLYLGTK